MAAETFWRHVDLVMIENEANTSSPSKIRPIAIIAVLRKLCLLILRHLAVDDQ